MHHFQFMIHFNENINLSATLSKSNQTDTTKTNRMVRWSLICQWCLESRHLASTVMLYKIGSSIGTYQVTIYRLFDPINEKFQSRHFLSSIFQTRLEVRSPPHQNLIVILATFPTTQ